MVAMSGAYFKREANSRDGEYSKVKGKATFRLWALPVTAENIVTAARNEYARIGDRILIYSASKRKPKGAYQITEELSKIVLSDEENGWLLRCNLTIYEKFIEEHEEEMKKGQYDFLRALEAELERERQRKQDGADKQ